MLRRTRALLRRLTGAPDERRAHPRHAIDVETDCRAITDDVDMPARIRNVSRSGVNLVVPRSQPEGTLIRVNLPVKGRSPQTTILACVTNVSVVAEGLWSLGCVFSLELSEAEMRVLGGEKRPSKPSDQRAWVRCPARGSVNYRPVPPDENTPKIAELVDLSPAGVGLIVSERIEPGSAITLNLPRLDQKPDRELLACVVYLTNRPDGKWAIGCNFLNEMSEKDLNDLVWRSTS